MACAVGMKNGSLTSRRRADLTSIWLLQGSRIGDASSAFSILPLLLGILDVVEGLFSCIHLTLFGSHHGLLRRQGFIGLARFSRLGGGKFIKSHAVFMQAWLSIHGIV